MTFYIACPAKRVTGGVELAHQLCFAINTLTESRALMWYTDIDNLSVETLVMDIPAPDEYAEYKTECAKDFWEIDCNGNIVVIPEGLTNRITLLDNARLVLWWMSVDNYISATHEDDIDDISNNVSLHLYQSYYSKDYVEKKIPNAKGMFLSDYINGRYCQYEDKEGDRDNVALYNPRKGYKELLPLIEKTKWLKWIPLQGMDRDTMVRTMRSAKAYVDFGAHPGKDRIPREAAANGCCVITNRAGAAAFYEDVPIPDKYKFQEPSKALDELDALLHDICDDFAGHYNDFNVYREMIFNENEKFKKDVISYVSSVENTQKD
jgi:hypothetical protein